MESTEAKTAQFLAPRARIVLRCAEGGTNKEIAAELGVSQGTVNRWRSRFIRLRLDGLTDEPRPGRPPSILLDQVQDVLTATLESTPGKDTHWSRASMAKHSGLPKSTIGRIWKKFDLKPHLRDAFKLSTDPQITRLEQHNVEPTSALEEAGSDLGAAREANRDLTRALHQRD